MASVGRRLRLVAVAVAVAHGGLAIAARTPTEEKCRLARAALAARFATALIDCDTKGDRAPDCRERVTVRFDAGWAGIEGRGCPAVASDGAADAVAAFQAALRAAVATTSTTTATTTTATSSPSSSSPPTTTPCGIAGSPLSPCCPDNTCIGNAACQDGRCVYCGFPGSPCCPGATPCLSGAVCTNGACALAP